MGINQFFNDICIQLWFHTSVSPLLGLERQAKTHMYVCGFSHITNFFPFHLCNKILGTITVYAYVYMLNIGRNLVSPRSNLAFNCHHAAIYYCTYKNHADS